MSGLRRRAIEGLGWRALLELGQVAPPPDPLGTTLVLAPHQDDETLGCGAAIVTRRAAGREVWVAFAGDGTRSHRSSAISPEELGRRRREEGVEACRRLGVPAERVVQLGFPEGGLGERALDLTRRVGDLLDEVRPDEVLVTSGLDAHPDHQALQRVAVELTARGRHDGALLEYPVWFWMGGWVREWSRRALAALAGRAWTSGRLVRSPLPVLVPARAHLERKRYALAAHASQMTRLTGERSWATLADVGGGRFLSNLFRDHEVLFRLQRSP